MQGGEQTAARVVVSRVKQIEGGAAALTAEQQKQQSETEKGKNSSRRIKSSKSRNIRVKQMKRGETALTSEQQRAETAE